MAAAADLADICSTGGGRTGRCWPWRYFEHEQLLRRNEQPTRRRPNFPGEPIIVQTDFRFGVVIALHDRSAAAVRKRSDGHRRWFSRMAELLGSADDLRRTPLPCYVSSNICREHATSASSLWIIFECHPSSNALSLVQVSVLGISGRLLPNALLICSLRHYYTRDDRVFSLPRRRSSQSVAAWRHYLLIDRDSLLASSTIPIADKSFPENLSHGFPGQLHGPITSWTAGETAAGYRMDYSCASRERTRLLRSNHRRYSARRYKNRIN